MKHKGIEVDGFERDDGAVVEAEWTWRKCHGSGHKLTRGRAVGDKGVPPSWQGGGRCDLTIKPSWLLRQSHVAAAAVVAKEELTPGGNSSDF